MSGSTSCKECTPQIIAVFLIHCIFIFYLCDHLLSCQLPRLPNKGFQRNLCSQYGILDVKSQILFPPEMLLVVKVHTLFWTKNSRTFQGLSRTHFPFFKDSIQCKKEPWVYVFSSSSTTWVILSQKSFCVCSFFFGVLLKLYSWHWNSRTFQHRLQLSRTFKALNFYFKIQGLSRCVRTLLLEFNMAITWAVTFAPLTKQVQSMLLNHMCLRIPNQIGI